jgi:hypothetical protein
MIREPARRAARALDAPSARARRPDRQPSVHVEAVVAAGEDALLLESRSIADLGIGELDPEHVRVSLNVSRDHVPRSSV